mmetsp:Transcript_33101/g.97484  ORF Transcript_33101/g.97484 Transcript_33101/m.97484 type:complete len:262 (+) Transcript_33101:807-1592(+)
MFPYMRRRRCRPRSVATTGLPPLPRRVADSGSPSTDCAFTVNLASPPTCALLTPGPSTTHAFRSTFSSIASFGSAAFDDSSSSSSAFALTGATLLARSRMSRRSDLHASTHSLVTLAASLSSSSSGCCTAAGLNFCASTRATTALTKGLKRPILNADSSVSSAERTLPSKLASASCSVSRISLSSAMSAGASATPRRTSSSSFGFSAAWQLFALAFTASGSSSLFASLIAIERTAEMSCGLASTSGSPSVCPWPSNGLARG